MARKRGKNDAQEELPAQVAQQPRLTGGHQHAVGLDARDGVDHRGDLGAVAEDVAVVDPVEVAERPSAKRSGAARGRDDLGEVADQQPRHASGVGDGGCDFRGDSGCFLLKRWDDVAVSVERERDGGKVGRRIAVRDGAADGAAVCRNVEATLLAISLT